MTQMTPGQARIVDPVLTTHALGYVRPGNVGLGLFPAVEVGLRAGKIVTFGKESFRRYSVTRAPGESTRRVTFGYQGSPYAIVDQALEAVVPDELIEESANGPGLDASRDAIDATLDIFELEHECQCAAIARDTGNYGSNTSGLTGQNRWKGTDGDPTANINTAKEAIRTAIGVRPNTILLSATAFAALKANAKIVDYMAKRGLEALTTQIISNLWEIPNVLIGEAVVAGGVNDSMSDVWGDDVILAYVAPPSGSNRRSASRPSFGYTYTLKGQPNVRMPYRDENRQSWIHQVTNNRTPLVTGILGGYLLQNAGGSPT